MLRSAALASFALVLCAPLLSGCPYSRHQPGYANGDNDQLYFARKSVTASSTEVIAVGAVLEVTVQHVGPQEVSCHGLGVRSSSPAGGAVHVQGGSIDTEHCAGVVGDPVKLVTATCDDDACTVEASQSDERSVTLRITGKRPAETRLRVSLVTADGGATYDDAAPLSFATAAAIQLNVDAADVAATKNPVLPGYSIALPSVAIVDDKARRLFAGESPPAPTFEGDAWVAADELTGRLVATRPGHTVVRWKQAGVPDRTLDLEVVDPSSARALLVYAALPPPEKGAAPPADADPTSVTADADVAGGRITSIAFDSPYADGEFPTRISLADGRLALAKLDTTDVAPYDLVYARAAFRSQSLLSVSASRAGKGTLTVGAGTMKLSVPVTVAPPPPKSH